MSNNNHHSISARGRVSTVSFKCKYNTSFGSSLFLVGNLKLLGDWDINNAIQLHTTSDTYPIWTQKNAFSCPVGTTIIYKYFVKDINGIIIWENLPKNANRQKIISKPGDFLIEDEENTIGKDLEQTENYNSTINDIKPKSLPIKEKEKQNQKSDKLHKKRKIPDKKIDENLEEEVNKKDKEEQK